MAKSKESSELEFLRKENRRLKSELRHYKKQITRNKKREHLLDDVEEREKFLDEDACAATPDESGQKCPKCLASVTIKEIGTRELHVCTVCTYRTSKRLNGQ